MKIRLPPLGALLAATLGVAASAAVFTLLYKVVLEPLPYGDPERLVTLWNTDVETKRLLPLSVESFLDVEAGETFEAVAAWSLRSVVLTGGDAERVSGAAVTPGFFTEVLRVGTLLGHSTLAAGEPAVVLGHGFWRRRFGGDPAVLGRRILLDGEPHVVVGVLEEGFVFENPEADLRKRIDLWQPLDLERTRRDARGVRFLRVLGRRSGGAEVPWGLTAVPLRSKLVEPVKDELRVLFGGVGLVLLVACGGVAGLFLIRLVERRHEVAIKTALGATPARIGREVATEVVGLWAVAGVLAILPALWAVELLEILSPLQIPRLSEGFEPGPETAAFALAFAVVGAAFNLLLVVPAALRGAPVRGRWRRDLVVAELALAVAVVTGAGLLAKSYRTLSSVELGFVPGGVLTARITLPRRYAGSHQVRAFFDELYHRLEALPDVERVAFTMALPLTGDEVSTVVEAETERGSWREVVDVRLVSPDYFEALGIRPVRGRLFETPDAIVVNEAMARQVDGRRLTVDWFGMTEIAGPVTGVVADVRFRRLDGTREPAVYLSTDQLISRSLRLVIRADDPERLVAPLRSVVAGLDADLPVDEIEPYPAVVARASAEPRFLAWVAGVYAGMTVVLSAVSLSSVLAYSVRCRLPEIGLRMALGASPERVFRDVLVDAGKLVAVALAVGALAARGVGRLLAGHLHGVGAADPVVLGGALALVAAAAFLAGVGPAVRAARADAPSRLQPRRSWS